MAKNQIAQFVKSRRKSLGLTQPEMARKAGVGLRLVRDLEQGKKTLRMDKVNQVLGLFGYAVGPVKKSPAASGFDVEETGHGE